MSERITTSTPQQEQVVTPAAAEQPPVAVPVDPAAEQTPASVPIDTSVGDASQAAKVAAESDAAEREAAAREETVKTLKDCVKAYARGEKAYRAGLLEAGRLANVYVLQRLALGDKREAAVQVLEGQLALYSSNPVDVNRLIGCHQAHALLAESQGKALVKAQLDNVPYGTYRDCWCRLVERTGKDTPAETWVVLPGLEEKALALFARSVKDGLSKAAVHDAVTVLVKEYAELQAEKRKAYEARAKAAAREMEAAYQKAEAERRDAARARAAAEDNTRKAETDAKAAKTEADQKAAQAQLDKANAEREERRKAEAEKQALADKAARERDAAEKAAKEAERAAAKAKADADKKTAREAEKAKDKTLTVEPAAESDKPAATPAKDTRPECRQTNILADLASMARKAPSKDMGMLLAGTVRAAEDSMAVLHDLTAILASQSDTDKACPYGADDVLEAVLVALDGHKALSAKGKRAVQAARLSLSRKSSPSPVDVSRALETSPAAAPEAGNGALTAAK